MLLSDRTDQWLSLSSNATACPIAKHLTEEMRDSQACRLPTLASLLAALALHTPPFSDIANLPSPAAPSWMTRPFFLKWSLSDLQDAATLLRILLLPTRCFVWVGWVHLSPGCRAQGLILFSLFPASSLSSDEYLQSKDLKYYLHVCDSQFHLSYISLFYPLKGNHLHIQSLDWYIKQITPK